MIKPSEEIQLAVERASGKAATHLHAAPVVETFGGKVVWEGIVHEFTVGDARYFAWAYTDPDKGGEMQYATVEGRSPFNTPIAAVRAWIVSLARK